MCRTFCKWFALSRPIWYNTKDRLNTKLEDKDLEPMTDLGSGFSDGVKLIEVCPASICLKPADYVVACASSSIIH